MLIYLLKLLLFTVFFLYLPSRAILKKFKVIDDDIIVNNGIILIFGCVFLTFITLFFRYFNLPNWTFYLIPLLSIGYIYDKGNCLVKPILKQIIPKKSFVLILFVIILGVLTQNLALFRGGWAVEGGRIFPSSHDTLWNIALTTELIHHFPPQHPGMAGEPLKNNHFLYPLFLSTVYKITSVDVFDLYYRIGPIFVSLVFGLSLYTISTIFSRNSIVGCLCVFLGYFSGNFAYLLPILFGHNIDWKGNSFYADQPFDQLINPYSVLGLAMAMFCIYAIYKTFPNKKRMHFGWGLVYSLMAGSLYGFKSFGGILVVSSLIFTSLFYILYYRNFKPFIILFVTLCVFAPIFFIISEPSKANLYWIPGWLLTEMMTSQNQLNLPNFASVENYYRSINNNLGLLKIKFIEFIIYFLGNLGTRLIGLIYILKLLFSQNRQSDHKFISIYIFLNIVIAFLIPIFFNLSGSPHNIIQFTPYALVLLAVLTAVTAGNRYVNLIKRNKKALGIILIVILIGLSIPVNVKNIISKIPSSGEKISNDEFQALQYLKNNSNSNAVILIDWRQFILDPMYVSAISERRIYLASEGYAYQTGRNPKPRQNKIASFYANSIDTGFLTENNIKYIYYLKEQNHSLFEERLNEKNINKIFENSTVIIFSI